MGTIKGSLLESPGTLGDLAHSIMGAWLYALPVLLTRSDRKELVRITRHGFGGLLIRTPYNQVDLVIRTGLSPYNQALTDLVIRTAKKNSVRITRSMR